MVQDAHPRCRQAAVVIDPSEYVRAADHLAESAGVAASVALVVFDPRGFEARAHRHGSRAHELVDGDTHELMPRSCHEPPLRAYRT
jgi:hypothetical protein